MEHTDQEYIDFNPFDGERDANIRLQSCKVVKVRKEQKCHLCQLDNQFLKDGEKPKDETIKVGEKARYEKALVDGEWGSWYACLPCMDKLLDL